MGLCMTTEIENNSAIPAEAAAESEVHLFKMAPLLVGEHTITWICSKNAAFSEILGAILARQEIEADPVDAINLGVQSTFDAVRDQMKMLYLFEPKLRTRMLADVDNYLARFPDVSVAECLRASRESPPQISMEGQGGDKDAAKRQKEQKAKAKRLQKQKAASKRRNRK
jgi:hypothetical protein